MHYSYRCDWTGQRRRMAGPTKVTPKYAQPAPRPAPATNQQRSHHPREIRLPSTLAAAAASPASAGATAVPTDTAAAAVDLAATKQPIHGFGRSLSAGGRRAQRDGVRGHYMDALFGDPAKHGGLGLNQVRYNIGGSDTAAGDAASRRPSCRRTAATTGRRRDAVAGGGRREAARR